MPNPEVGCGIYTWSQSLWSSQHVGGDRQQNKKLQQTVVGSQGDGGIQVVLIIHIQTRASHSLSKEENFHMRHSR